MATHSNVLAWRIPGMVEPSMGWAAIYAVAQSRTRLKRLSGSSRKDQKVKSTSYRKSNRVEPLISHMEKGQERERARGEGGKKEGENLLNLNQTIQSLDTSKSI